MEGEETAAARRAFDREEAEAFGRYEALQGLYVRYLLINGCPPEALLDAVEQARSAWRETIVARDRFLNESAQPLDSLESF
jgi:hypothetical protein